LDPEEASKAYQDLHQNTNWEKTAKINRWVSLTHENLRKDYKYRDAPGEAVVGFGETVQRLQRKAEAWIAQKTGQTVHFNVCLLNFYENGQQRIGWHADREEIGRTTPIASVSLGATRQFLIRSKTQGVQDRAALPLTSGSLVIMDNVCQLRYLHSIPRENDASDGRINLTFRCKEESTAGEEEHDRRDNWLDALVDGVVPDAAAWSAKNANQSANRTSIVFGDGVVYGYDLDATTIRYLVKTNLGAECYCAAELQEMFHGLAEVDIVARPCGMDGFVAVCAENDLLVDSYIVDLLLQLKTAHHVLQYHAHFDLETLTNEVETTTKLISGETVYQYFRKQLVEGTVSLPSVAKAETFRVTCERFGGPHTFNSAEIEL
jgi:alkylated DNA repair dioxygenase AlkB